MVDITFVCLSKSKKNHEFCVAGKIIHADGSIGQWIRPVNKFGSIDERDCLYADKSQATSLDVITATFIRGVPQKFQTENYLIDSEKYWVKRRGYDFNIPALNKLCDQPQTLWTNNHESGGGIKDQVSPAEAANIKESLYFIYVGDITIYTSRWQNEKVKVRGEFVYNGVTYNLKITDLFWLNYYEDKELGKHPLNGRYITISLALETYGGFHYKLIAEMM